LSGREQNIVSSLIEAMKEFEEATKFLQSDDVSLSDAHSTFDTLKESLENNEFILSFVSSETLEYVLRKLSLNSRDVSDPSFESGVVKVLNNCQSELSSREKTSIQCLLKNASINEGRVILKGEIQDSAETKDDEISSSFTERMNSIKKRRIARPAVEYLNLHFILPTSNTCEQFFSSSGRCYTDLRRSLSSENLESQLFLYYNRDLWDISTISEYRTQ
jgi:hypothetical protein